MNKEDLKYMRCELCKGNNFKCFEFEDIVTIFCCKDCGGHEFSSADKFPRNKAIRNYVSPGKAVCFRDYYSDYPRFEGTKTGDIIQINGSSFWTKNKMAKKKVYDMPKGLVIKQYNFMIKNFKKDLEVTEKRLNKIKVK